MSYRAAVLTLTLFFASTLTLSAQGMPPIVPTIPMIPVSATPLADAISRAPTTDVEPTVTLWSLSQPPRKRPGALPVLYSTYGVLAAMDIVTTKRAIAAGAYEANPLAKGGNLASSIAIKAGTGVATFFAAEKLWKKSRVGAIVVMVAANSLSAAVVAQNERNTRKARK